MSACSQRKEIDLMTDETVAELAYTDLAARLDALLEQLALEEKVQLLTGRDFWTTWPIEKIGLRRILFSDGPAGVRGEVWDERHPSLNLPSGTALASSWDAGIARRYGSVMAIEARSKGVDVVLGPTINLHRSPLGGRHFEAFSEDPVLTADLAAAFISGVQDNGVGATPKHYVANDFETDRFTVDVQVDDRTLREVYLLAFEKSITEARAWLVMSAYNSINGVTATENELLETPLNSEWEFDGVVVSDWTAVRSIAAAPASQDLVMPGPAGPWGDALIAAVRSGAVAESAVDRKVLRILHLAARVGALEGFDPAVAEPPFIEDGVAFAREAAAAGSVLLSNNGELPWSAAPSSIAVIGHNAAFARTQGGGSATVIPSRTVSPLSAIRESLPQSAVSFSVGAVVQEGVAPLPLETLFNVATGEPGVRVTFADAAGKPIYVEDRLATSLVWFGGDVPIRESKTLEFVTRFTSADTEEIRLGFAAVGAGTIWVDGNLVLDTVIVGEGTDLGAALLAPPSASAKVGVIAGVPIDIRILFGPSSPEGALSDALGFTFGLEPSDHDADELIAEAVAAAKAAEVAVVVVGTNSRVESEGYDRSSLALPGRQDDLVRAVVAANPRTVVVVNAGAPVLMPWRNDVAALLVGYFGGQEFGDAILDVLLGTVEPGGRLPTTWPKVEADVPVLNVTPENGIVRYDEGIHIGYRAWLKSETEPAFAFGHGLGYTTFELDEFTVPGTVEAGEVFEASGIVTNSGDRAGKAVLQVYAERTGSVVDRPVRWLVGFASAVIPAGESATLSLEVSSRLLAYWSDGWVYEEGEYVLHAGFSVVNLPHSAPLLLEAGDA